MRGGLDEGCADELPVVRAQEQEEVDVSVIVEADSSNIVKKRE